MEAQTEPAAVIQTETSGFDFDSVFQAEYRRIARVIARLVKDSGRAEELAIGVFWKLSRTAAAQGPAVSGWLYKTAIRTALDDLRKQYRRQRYERLFFLSRQTSTENPEASLDRQDCVRSVLASLDKRTALMLVLRSEKFTYEDIAQALAINPASVGTLLRRAQEAFRKEYIKRYGKP